MVEKQNNQYWLLFLRCTACILVLFFACAVQAQEWRDYDWRLKKQDSGITVATAKVPGSKFRAVLSTMTVSASLSSLVSLVTNPDDCVNWVDFCVHSETHRRESQLEYWQYSISRMPWPLRKRDLVMHVTLSQEPTDAIVIIGKAEPDEVPVNKGLIRIEQAQSFWVFTPLPENKVRVENYIHADPGGGVPAWLMNQMLVDHPWNTLVNMRERIASEEYRFSRLAYIRD